MHYISSNRYDMYIEKTNLQNEELSFSFANGNDWWFHAKGAPGSHVIVKSNGDELRTVPLKKQVVWPLTILRIVVLTK